MPPVASAPAAPRAATGSATGTDDRQPAGSAEDFMSALAALAGALAVPAAAVAPVPEEPKKPADPGTPDATLLAAAMPVALAAPLVVAPSADLGTPAPVPPPSTPAIAPAITAPATVTQPLPGLVAPEAAPAPAEPTPVAKVPVPPARTAAPAGPPAQPAAAPVDVPQAAPQQTAPQQAAPQQTAPQQLVAQPAARPASDRDQPADPAPVGTPPAAATAPVAAPATGTDNRPSEDPRRDQSTGPQAPAPAAAVTAAAPAAPVAEVTAPAAPAQPAAPLPPAAQVAVHIVPLRREADGVHRLTVHLHPDDLGPVRVVAEIRDGGVSVQLASGTETGREALHEALPQLRQELLDAGFTNCSLDLRQEAAGGGPEYRQPAPGQPSGPGTAAPVAAPAPPEARPAVDRNRLLDLRV